MSAEAEVETQAEAEVEVEVEATPVHDPTDLDQYASAAERAKHIHIRDVDTEPRWNGHAPTDTAYGGSQMIVCKHCGALAWTRQDMAEGQECSGSDGSGGGR